VVYDLARLRLPRIPVCPVAGRRRRVERQERHGELAAAQRGLLDVTDLRLTGKLVGLLKPVDADVSKRQLDGFELFRLVQAEEKDLLARGKICDLHGRHRAPEHVLKAQRADGPLDLRVHAVAQRIGDLAQHHRVALRMLQKENDKSDADKRGFGGPAPTLAHHRMRLLVQDPPQQISECRGYSFIYEELRQ